MKNSILFFFVLVLAFASCKDKEDDMVPTISPLVELQSIANCGSSETLVTADWFNGIEPGTPVLITNTAITVGNFDFQLGDESTGIKTGIIFGNERVDAYLINGSGTEALKLTCDDGMAPTGQVNEIAALLSDIISSPNCGSQAVEVGFQSFNGWADEDVQVIVSLNSIEIVGVYTYVIDPVNGIPTDVGITEIRSIPLKNGHEDTQILMKCAGGALPNDVLLLQNYMLADTSCNSLVIPTDFWLNNIHYIPAGTVLSVTETHVVFEGIIALEIDEVNGNPTTIFIGSEDFTIPLIDGPAQIFADCSSVSSEVNEMPLLMAAVQADTNCVAVQLAAEVWTNLFFVPNGTGITPSSGSIVFDNVGSLTVDPINGTPCIINLNGTDYSVPVVDGPASMLWECVSPLQNDMPLLTAAVQTDTNCISVQLAAQVWTNTIFADVGTGITLSSGNIIFNGIGSLVVDPINGTPCIINLNGVDYSIPVVDGPNSMLFECVAPQPNQAQELYDAIQAEPSCSPLLQSGVSTPSGWASAQTQVTVTPNFINIDGVHTYIVDPVNGVPCQITFNNGATFVVPLVDGPAQILIGCEQAMVLPVVGFFHSEYSDLIAALGGTITNNGGTGTMKVFPDGRVYLDNICSERYTIPSEGIDYPKTFIVEITGGQITKYGFELDQGSITTQHWYDNANGQKVRFIYDGYHSSKYSNNPPGTPGGDGFINVVVECP